jgi:membrane-bound lytic murein transglycosylase D
MAAYDWGPGNVQRAVSRTGYADYWELYRRNVLPAETKAYVPGIIAVMIMAKNPAQYGLTNLVADAPVLSDTVNTTYAIDLKLVADLTGATLPEIVALNPALLRLTTPRDLAYDLHLPPGTRSVFLDRLKDIPEDSRATWRFHIVKEGETLDQIAASLHARAAEIAQFNEVTPAQPIETGDELIIPIEGVSASGGQQRYTLGRSDTLVTVADRFGVTVEQLRSWNHLSSGRVRAGRSLYVSEPIRLAPGSRSSRGRRGRRGSRGRSGTGRSIRSSRSNHSSHASAPSFPATAHSTKKHRR